MVFFGASQPSIFEVDNLGDLGWCTQTPGNQRGWGDAWRLEQTFGKSHCIGILHSVEGRWCNCQKKWFSKGPWFFRLCGNSTPKKKTTFQTVLPENKPPATGGELHVEPGGGWWRKAGAKWLGSLWQQVAACQLAQRNPPPEEYLAMAWGPTGMEWWPVLRIPLGSVFWGGKFQWLNLMEGGTLLVINWVITPISRVKWPQ